MKFYVKLTFISSVFVAVAAIPISVQTSDDDNDDGEYGDYFEGDMLLTEEEKKEIEAAKMPDDDNDDNAPKNGLKLRSRRWPDKTVVYDLRRDNLNDRQVKIIMDALKEIEDNTCIKFRKKGSTDLYAVIIEQKRRDCFSELGFKAGRNQVLNLGKGCIYHGIVIHEMLHTLGFVHMQSTYDRDDFVTIHYENIERGYRYNFNKYTNSTVTDFGVPYDYVSIMHYEEKAFSKNGKRTIVPKKEGVIIGQRKGLSNSDILKMKSMYDCPNEGNTEHESTTDSNEDNTEKESITDSNEDNTEKESITDSNEGNTEKVSITDSNEEENGEYGDYFEGDMLLTKEQEQEIENANMSEDDNAPKNGLRLRSARWPNKTVVYDLRRHNLNDRQVKIIMDALKEIEDNTCVKFRKKEDKDSYAVVIEQKYSGCYAELGFKGGRNQVLNLGKGCIYHGIVIHEMLHTLGFYHMQSTYDRDDFVKIEYQNIQRGKQHNFQKYNNSTVTDFGVPYDYGSIMHYGDKAFSKNGKRTIIPKKEGVTIGQRKGLSNSDILKTKSMYECPNEGNTENESTTDSNEEEKGEYGDYFEGDMLLTKEQEREIEDAKMSEDDNDDNAPKNGLRLRSARWPDKTVVYDLRRHNLNDRQVKIIMDALKEIEDNTCVKFRKKEDKDSYAVVIEQKYSGCYAEVGFKGGRNQVLNLGKGCIYHGIVIHEMLHTLGFYHMQSTYDRDDYVKIEYQNIQPGMRHNFQKYSNSTVTDFGVPYDYGSIMHYDDKAFSKNGKRTIIPKKEGVTIGQREGLSNSDILKVNSMYECPNKDEYGDYFEGDMMLSKEQEQEIEEANMSEDDNDDNAPKNGLRLRSARWPNKTVVYDIRRDNLDDHQVKIINGALEEIEDNTCIKFRMKEANDLYAVLIQQRRPGCSSEVGFKRSRYQVLNLGKGCIYHGIVIHEMLHTLGFFHMQSTYDRDDFVTIVYPNIQPGKEHNFKKYTKSTISDFGVPYDYGSIMHYHDKAFSKNGKRTIVTKKKDVTIGQRKGLSRSDILKMKIMYECPNKGPKEEESITDLNWLDDVEMPIKP